VVLLNSVIHTPIYTDFLIKTISPATEIKSARYLTKAQIGHFLIGIASTVGIFSWVTAISIHAGMPA
jgi:hypothetical protein